MPTKTMSLSIRLLKDGLQPNGAVKNGVSLVSFPNIPNSLWTHGVLGDAAPKWVNFLHLNSSFQQTLKQRLAYSVLFVESEKRWFAFSFGLGHSQLEPDTFEQDFGLRVVLNTVDPQQLRSADIRTPTENTLSTRSQTSRKSDQSAFGIDIERNIVRGMMGTPSNSSFGSAVSGGDALSLKRKCEITDLPSVCSEVLLAYSSDAYKSNFAWIDQVKHVRDQTLIDQLQTELIAVLQAALNGMIDEDLHLAYPDLFDPDKKSMVKFRGFGKTEIYDDPDIEYYIEELKKHSITTYDHAYLHSHKVEPCDEHGTANDTSWKIQECIVLEVELSSKKYVLSGGRWYEIDPELAKEVKDFFENLPKSAMPPAQAGDNEEIYNKRIRSTDSKFVYLDRNLIKPSGAATQIEACDFLSDDLAFIHVKDKTSSSCLSHLFSQGLVSSRVMRRDEAFRQNLVAKVKAIKDRDSIATALEMSFVKFEPASHAIRFCVLTTRPKSAKGAKIKDPQLPFFSLVTLRQSARQIKDELGYPVSFSWIIKPSLSGGKKRVPKTKTAKTTS